jgi:hypothetical protein
MDPAETGIPGAEAGLEGNGTPHYRPGPVHPAPSYLGLMRPVLQRWFRSIPICCLVAVHSPVRAQLIVDTVPDVHGMLIDLFGPSVSSISNVQTLGATNYRGLFDGTASDLGLDQGILLANGDIHLAIGPNDTVEAGIFDGSGLIGDADLTAIAGYPTQDASVIEFDFVPASDTIHFHFAFGSEEYPEWVSYDVYNDVFAILLDGVNIALLPDASPVCVDNVNCSGSNTPSYRCNDPMNAELVPCANSFNCPDSIAETTIQYDGITVPLHAFAVLDPGTTHHLKIGVADVSDNGADSGGFLSVTWSVPVVGIPSLSSDGRVIISPNPNEGSFTCRVPHGVIGHITVLDPMGRSVLESEKNGMEGRIVLPSSPPGIYRLVIGSSALEHVATFVVLP